MKAGTFAPRRESSPVPGLRLGLGIGLGLWLDKTSSSYRIPDICR